MPRLISWNVTFRCPLRCAHCYIDAGDRIEVDELDTGEGMDLIDRICEVGRPILVLSGGEPLLRPDIFDLAAHATARGLRVANVDPSGNVYPCQFAQNEAFLVGNVREQRFSDLWNDPGNRVLSLFRDDVRPAEGRCGSCTGRAICGGGCLVRAYASNRDIRTGDPFCPEACTGAHPDPR
jgi:radical SAM protein with 4Fe4S-binding SPASM domain